jgi:hypothetical protein
MFDPPLRWTSLVGDAIVHKYWPTAVNFHIWSRLSGAETDVPTPRQMMSETVLFRCAAAN